MFKSIIFEHSISLLVGLSVSRSIGLSVDLSATSFMEVLCCYKCIIVVTVVVVYDSIIFCCHILHF